MQSAVSVVFALAYNGQENNLQANAQPHHCDFARTNDMESVNPGFIIKLDLAFVNDHILTGGGSIHGRSYSMDTTRVLRRERCGTKSYTDRDCQIFRLRCDITNSANLNNLTELIRRALDEGRKTIVLSVTADSYLYSELIAHIVKYERLVRQYHADFCLVEEDLQLRHVLQRIGLTRLVRVVSSENEAIAR